MIKRPNEYRRDFEPKPSQVPYNKDVMSPEYKDKRDEVNKPATDTNIFEEIEE